MPEAKAKASVMRRRWANRISKAQRDLQTFHEGGNKVVDTYRIEQRTGAQKDKYNILYAITETIKPSLYSQTPKPEVARRNKDKASPVVLAATLLQESALTYTVDEQDLDGIMKAAVEDYLLPGLGQVWLRYQPTITQNPQLDDEDNPVLDTKGEVVVDEEVTYEQVVFEYVNWKDFLWGKCARWVNCPWAARRVYIDRKAAIAQFGKPLARKLSFKHTSQGVANDNSEIDEDTCAIWEIWDKKTGTIIWYCETYEEDILKVEKDFLKLKHFFPCPEPMRAVTTTNKFTPRPFYAQYQAQADELNDITARIRLLVDGLRVVGIYDASVDALKNLLSGGANNKMVPVDGWAMVQEKGGLKGVVDFLPIADVINALMQLYDARERVKTEIYEITGWSDIIRGVSKASETLGAQQLKAEWAGARLKMLQKDVQRFVRDIFRIAGEIIAEHFTPEMLFTMSGIDEQAIKQPGMAQMFAEVVKLLHDEKDRCAFIDVETDSTLLPDEANDKAERMEFVGAVGAFLQQAVPAMQAAPALGPVLGEILMFSVRGFRGARTMEATFEQFVQQMAANPPKPPEEKGDGGAGAAASANAKIADTQAKTGIAQATLAQDAAQHQADIAVEREKEQNRHNEKMLELKIRAAELGIKEDKVTLDAHNAEQDRVRDSVEKAEDRRLEDAARAEESAHRDADRAAQGQGSENA